MANLQLLLVSAAAQIKHMAEPFLHPNHVSGFCETGLTHEKVALHFHRFSKTCKGRM